MTGAVKNLALVISIFMVAVTATGCSSQFVPRDEKEAYTRPTPSPSASGATNGLIQSHSGGGVTIDVEWVSAENTTLIFDVAMNTHEVDLDQYDLGKLAILRDDSGIEYLPASWKSASGGHHRQGTLIFTLPDSVSQSKAKYIEIMIRDVAGIKERLLKWEL